MIQLALNSPTSEPCTGKETTRGARADFKLLWVFNPKGKYNGKRKSPLLSSLY